jgi:hypothetical protein
MSFLLLFLMTFFAFAQESDYQFQVSGSYSTNLPGLSRAQKIKFNLQWNEKKQMVNGIYKDGFFTNGTEAVGTVGAEGRVFNIKLPRIVQNVANLSITANNGTLMVFMKDQTAMTIDQVNILASIVKNIGYVEKDEVECSNCGIYSGKIRERTDSNNKCLLPDYNFRMEITTEKKLTLYYYYSDLTIGIPTHELGIVTLDSDRLEHEHKHCGVLVGTKFLPENCQKLSINGNFTAFGDRRNFRGMYVIQDTKRFERCSYELVLEREKGG